MSNWRLGQSCWMESLTSGSSPINHPNSLAWSDKARLRKVRKERCRCAKTVFGVTKGSNQARDHSGPSPQLSQRKRKRLGPLRQEGRTQEAIEDLIL